MENEENFETDFFTEKDTTDFKMLYETEQVKNKDLGDKIYKLKKESKSQTTETPWNSSEEMEKFYNEKKFYETNPWMEEYKEQLSEFTSKGNSLEDAKYLLEKNDPTIANRKIANQTNFTAWEPANNSKTTYTMDELKNLSQIDYNRVMELKAKGKVNIN